AYVAARASFDTAIADANRTTKYVAAHVPPTRAERSEYPQKLLWLASISATLALIWSIGLLVYYSVRDRR
ncbi:MAG: sugar transporter, partial [Pseudomonadota bacterium]